MRCSALQTVALPVPQQLLVVAFASSSTVLSRAESKQSCCAWEAVILLTCACHSQQHVCVRARDTSAPQDPRISLQLCAGRAEQFFETEGYDGRGSNVMRMMGYFSLVGLQRVHALIGDYHTALAVLTPIQPFQKAKLFAQKISGALQVPD